MIMSGMRFYGKKYDPKKDNNYKRDDGHQKYKPNTSSAIIGIIIGLIIGICACLPMMFS